MRILVTNDDGILSPGLTSLVAAASEFGEVFVVAPQEERSGISHAITLAQPLRAQHVKKNWWALAGMPADCIFVGVHHLMPGKPDLILSGINKGPNMGLDVLYSGTVGGAMEGTIQGIPSVAFSLVARHDFPFEWSQGAVSQVLKDVVAKGLPDNITLNVNIPGPEIAPLNGYRLTKLGSRIFAGEVIARVDPRGEEYFWLGGTRIDLDSAPDTDIGAVRDGFVSITPIKPDMMAHEALGVLGHFDRQEVPE